MIGLIEWIAALTMFVVPPIHGSTLQIRAMPSRADNKRRAINAGDPPGVSETEAELTSPLGRASWISAAASFLGGASWLSAAAPLSRAVSFRRALYALFFAAWCIGEPGLFAPVLPAHAQGNVIGPASSTVGCAAPWANTTGTLLASSCAIQISGTNVLMPSTYAGLYLGNQSVASTPSINFFSSGNSNYDVQLAAVGGTSQAGGGTLFLAGTLEIAPVAASYQAALLTAQSGPTTGGPINANQFFNSISISSDQTNTGGGNYTADALAIRYSFGGSQTFGARQSLDVVSTLTAATGNASGGNPNYVAGNFTMIGASSDGGTGVTNTTAVGLIFGASPTGVLTNSGVSNMYEVAGTQASVSMDSTASTYGRVGLQISSIAWSNGGTSDGLGHGSGADDAILLSNGIGSFNVGIDFSSVWAAAPLSTSGTAIKFTGAQTFATFADISSATVTSYIIKGPSSDFLLTGTGVVTAGTWNGTVIGATYGGTGVDNGSNTLTLGASLTTTGSGAPTLAFPSSSFTYTFPSAGADLAYLIGSATSGHCVEFSGTGGGLSDTGSACVVNGGALGTPSSGTLTNATGLPVSTGLSGAGTGVLTAMGNAVNGGGGLLTYAALGQSNTWTATQTFSGVTSQTIIPSANITYTLGTISAFWLASYVESSMEFTLQVGSTGASVATGEAAFAKISASGSAPGAGWLKFEAVAGTNSGTCKLIAYAGTSTTPTTIIDNVGGGC